MWNKIKNDLKDWRIRRAARRNGSLPEHRIVDLERVGQTIDATPIPSIFTGVVVWLVCTLLLSLPAQRQWEGDSQLQPGQLVPHTIVARFDFYCVDFRKEEEQRKEAEDKNPDCFQISLPQTNAIKADFNLFFNNPPPDLPPSARQTLNRANDHTDDLKENFFKRLDEFLQRGIMPDAEKKRRALEKSIVIRDDAGRRRQAHPLSEISSGSEAALILADTLFNDYSAGGERDELAGIFRNAFRKLIAERGNLVYNETVTAETLAEKLAKNRTPPRFFKKNSTIASRNEIATPELCKTVAEYMLQERKSGFSEERQKLLRYALWSFILLVFSAFYLHHLHPDILCANKRVVLLGGVIVTALLANYGAMRYYEFLVRGGQKFPGYFLAAALPFALAPVMLAVIFGYRVSLCSSFFVVSISVLMLQNENALEQALKGLAICSAAALAVRSATNYRTYFFRILLTVIPLGLLLNGNLLDLGAVSFVKELLIYAGVVFAASLVTALAALMMIFFLEMFFNVSTNMALMVLCDYNHPLLEQLKREAPGTFFHSLMVATLVEDAAKCIRANPLKAKAGALFHDIGKLQRPQYFTENNFDNVNLHTTLNPQMSSIIIRDHVKDGLELARQYRLCRTVRDAIDQHHGTDLVQFFYRKALEQQKEVGGEVLESQFRYTGHLPHDKEMAIISLADACEAACRSLDKATPMRIEQQVDEIVLRRYQDGQLDDADLTLAELHKVRQSFVQTLVSMKHGRIDYRKELPNDEDTALLEKPSLSPTESKDL